MAYYYCCENPSSSRRFFLTWATIMFVAAATMIFATLKDENRAHKATQWRRSLKQQGVEKNRRKFVSYTSSEWEFMWLKNADKWTEANVICDILWGAHREFVHEFLDAVCTSRYHAPHNQWCLIDDEYHPLWYNTANRETFQLTWENPLPPDARVDQPAPVIPRAGSLDHILSKFVFLDEETGETYVEHIEPLVSHLRFPLAKCIGPLPDLPQYEHYATTFRGFILPPPRNRKDRAVYFDAGASSWDKGSGGPSLQYFFNLWKRHGIEFDDIYAFDTMTVRDDFYAHIPLYFSGKTHYQQAVLASLPKHHSEEHPFLPTFIKEKVSALQDYVLLKLDIDSATIEEETILNILEDPDTYIDEIAWEHHIRGNYLMQEWGQPDLLPDMTLRQSMEFFLLLRQRGIRAHSWI